MSYHLNKIVMNANYVSFIETSVTILLLPTESEVSERLANQDIST